MGGGKYQVAYQNEWIDCQMIFSLRTIELEVSGLKLDALITGF